MHPPSEFADCAAPYRSVQRRLLHRHYGYPSLHPEQQIAIDAVLSGTDVSVSAPTSFGKSLCYIIPALVRFHLPSAQSSPEFAQESHAVTIVISPLLALINDQVSGLKSKKIPAAMLSSSQTPKQNNEVLASLTGSFAPPFALLYVTAERVTSASFLNTLIRLQNMGRLALFAVDEAHCISQWGHDFRKSYAQLGVLRDTIPGIPIIALTGSARPRVASSILESLKIPSALKVQRSFLRSNIRYVVEYVDGSLCSTTVEKHMVEFILARPSETGVIYVHKRSTVDDVIGVLKSNDISCVGYHGGMTNKAKRIMQEDFESRKALVCVATNAFGMGIDVSCVRYVLNHSLPASMEAYYQESGRAGRDGLPCTSVLYFGKEDARLKTYLASRPTQKSNADKATTGNVERAVAAVQAVVSYCNSTTCRRVTLLKHFGEHAKATNICSADGCDVCASVQEVKRRMITAVPCRRRGCNGDSRVGRFLPSSVAVATPAADFQSARSLARRAPPADSIDYREAPSDAEENEVVSDSDMETLKVPLASDDPASVRKHILALAAAEEAETATSKRQLGAPSIRSMRRHSSHTGTNTGFLSARTVLENRQRDRPVGPKSIFTRRRVLGATGPGRTTFGGESVSVAVCHNVEEVNDFSSDSSEGFEKSAKRQRR